MDYSTVVFTTEKNLHISGPMQFKPVMFKKQLYISQMFCEKHLISD